MRIVWITRKVFNGSVTQNCVDHGTGALNVRSCRVGSEQIQIGHNAGDSFSQSYKENGTSPERTHYTTATGRWPGNVVLQHLPGCKQSGTTMVPGYTINRFTDGAKPFGDGAGHEYESETMPDEAVVVWKCVAGCGAQSLNAQGGPLRARGNIGSSKGGGGLYGHGPTTNSFGSGDAGTAARFFMQVTIMDELIEYLLRMIAPPAQYDPVVIVGDPSEIDWDSLDAESVHGAVLTDDPGEHMEHVDRVLKPGAHLLVVSPESEPTGHTAACRIEDAGFEIRDSILLLDQPDGFCYTGKASPREKHAGVLQREVELTGTRYFPIEGAKPKIRKAIDAALAEVYEEDPELVLDEHGLGKDEVPPDLSEHFVSRKVTIKRKVRNHHPTVKSVSIMEFLLCQIDPSVTVIDPFLGSGTTGLAATRTGHDFIGIDKEEPYLRIAQERIAYNDSCNAGWNRTEIESDLEDEEPEAIDVFDVFS